MITLSYDQALLLIVAVCLVSYRLGYRKHERDRERQRRRIWKQEQEKLPRVLKGSTKRFSKN